MTGGDEGDTSTAGKKNTRLVITAVTLGRVYRQDGPIQTLSGLHVFRHEKMKNK